MLLSSSKSFIGAGLRGALLDCIAGYSALPRLAFTNTKEKGKTMVNTEAILSCAEEARSLAREVCPIAGVTLKQIFSRSRYDDVALARQIVMTLLTNRGWSLSQVGRALGRHHGTVIHARLAVADRYKRDRHTTHLVNRLARAGVRVFPDDKDS